MLKLIWISLFQDYWISKIKYFNQKKGYQLVAFFLINFKKKNGLLSILNGIPTILINRNNNYNLHFSNILLFADWWDRNRFWLLNSEEYIRFNRFLKNPWFLKSTQRKTGAFLFKIDSPWSSIWSRVFFYRVFKPEILIVNKNRVRDRSKLPCLPTGRHVARIARPAGHAIQKKKKSWVWGTANIIDQIKIWPGYWFL